MEPLPPLDCLKFFEAAARHQSFVRAAEELQVTPAAVAYRLKILEDYLGHALFVRSRRGITLNPRGTAYLADVQRLLTEVRDVMHRYRQAPPTEDRLRLVVVESIAERWLMPHLADFTTAWPAIAIEMETDHLGINPHRQEFDCWISYANEQRPLPLLPKAHREVLFEEPLFPVCSPALLAARGRPRTAVDLHAWPLVYHLDWPAAWTYWYEAHGHPPPDLSHASGFRMCSLVIQAAVEGMGVMVSIPRIVHRDIQQGSLVPLFDWHNQAVAQCYMVTTAAAWTKPAVQAFRDWVLALAGTAAASGMARTTVTPSSAVPASVPG